MERLALLIVTGCLAVLAAAAVRFVWVATPAERLLTLALAASVFVRRPRA